MPKPNATLILVAGMLVSGKIIALESNNDIMGFVFCLHGINFSPVRRLSGVANTILNKLQDMQCVENCSDPDPSKRQYFEQPVWQT
jgi:hypothetical protein